MQAGRRRLASRMPAAWPALLAGGVLLLAAFVPTVQGQQATGAGWGARQPPSLGLSLPPPAEAALPPLRPDELERLLPQPDGPAIVGLHRQLPDAVQLVTVAPDGRLVDATRVVKQADALQALQKKQARAMGRKAAAPVMMPWTATANKAQTFAPGAWQDTVAGRVWRLQISSPEATALRVHFQNFNVGNGRVWLRNGKGQVDGPYAGQGMFGDGDFWSDNVLGDSLTIEYQPDPLQASAALAKAVPFRIRRISHRVTPLPGSQHTSGQQKPRLGGSLSQKAANLLPDKQVAQYTCHHNVKCYWDPDGTRPDAVLEQWVHTKELSRGVGLIIFEKNGESKQCSGVAINHKDNLRQSYDPGVHDKVLFLTAAHCIYEEEHARSAIVYWKYTAGCGQNDGFVGVPSRHDMPKTKGATLLATTGVNALGSWLRDEGDATLLQLTGKTPTEAEVVLQAWDVGGPPQSNAVGIHHPDGMPQAVSVSNGRTSRYNKPSSIDEPSIYYGVQWITGTTEGGSSGSPMFVNGKVYGVLSHSRIWHPCRQGQISSYSNFEQFYAKHAETHLNVGGGELTSWPTISEDGVVLATGTPVQKQVAPGAIINIYGKNLAPPGTALGPQLDEHGNIATHVADVCVRINKNQYAPLLYVSPRQINAQLPYSMFDSFSRDPYAIVYRNCILDEFGRRNSVAQKTDRHYLSIQHNELVSPAFFNFASNPDGINPVAAQHGDGLLVAPEGLIPGATPARPGEVITVYGTGFGDTDPLLKAGEIPGRAVRLANPVSFTIGGIEAPIQDVLYAGAAPCCAGLNQFVLRIPNNVPAGNQPIIATINGVSSPEGPYLAIGGGQQ